jgi:hypothetical protein
VPFVFGGCLILLKVGEVILLAIVGAGARALIVFISEVP